MIVNNTKTVSKSDKLSSLKVGDIFRTGDNRNGFYQVYDNTTITDLVLCIYYSFIMNSVPISISMSSSVYVERLPNVKINIEFTGTI